MKYISILLTLILLTILVSCNKDETVTPGNNTNTQNQTNTFIGYTSAYDYLYPDSNQNANIEVTVLGTNDQVIKTGITDSNGRFGKCASKALNRLSWA